MYDIKEVAKKMKISQSAVYKQIKSKEVQQHIFKKENKTFITEEGFDFLKYKKENYKQIEKEVKNNTIENNSTPYTIEVLNDTIQLLKEQLKIKDEQITNLTDLNKNAQVLMKEQQNKVILLEEESQKSWWQKMFK